MPTLATNKRARFDYTILEELEAGLVLTGAEVKSTRQGHVQLKASYVTTRGTGHDGAPEAWLVNAHISPYPPASARQVHYDPAHDRKLLLTRTEIDRIVGKIKAERLTLVPLSLYTAKSKIKVKLGLARGKRQYEKRETLRKRAVDREVKQRMKQRP